MFFFPALIFFEYLPRHMLGYASSLIKQHPIRIFTSHTIANNIGALNKVGVGSSAKLEGRDSYQRKDHVGRSRPREVLFLLNLKGKVHRRVHATFPMAARKQVAAIPLVDYPSNGLEVISREPITKVWGLHKILVDDEPLAEV
jgi:hypothetical protein